MKKFLALLFVCAGLTAMAGVPQINKADLGSVKGEKVMKATNTLGNVFSAPAMQTKSNRSVSAMAKDIKVNFGENRLAKKAPRRLSDEDVVAIPYIDFRYCYTVDSTGAVVEDAYHYRGNLGNYWQIYNDVLYCAGLYWSQNTGSSYYLPLNIDYTTGLVELPPIGLLDDDTISGRVAGTNPTTYTDTIDFSYMVDGKWLFGETEDFNSVYGTMYSDGTIEFNDTVPYVFAGYRALVTYKRSGTPFTGYTYSISKTDTTEFIELYYGTQLIVPNANHQFGYIGSGSSEKTYNQDVYMYQADDTTVIVFGPWGFGYPGRWMNIYADGTMVFPAQYVYNSDDGDYLANATFELDENMGFIFDADGYVDGFIGYGNEGTVTPDAITWESTVMMTEEGSLLYPFIHNILTFTDGTQFVLGGGTDFVLGDVNKDEIFDIADVTALINALLIGDLDDSDEFSSDASDYDESGEIDIADVTAMINALLTSK